MIPEIREGDPITHTWLNEIVRELRACRNLVGGPGVTILKAAGGGSVSVDARALAARMAEEEPTGGVLKPLAAVQATEDIDTYDRSTDDCPVSVKQITDIEYDTTVHKLYYRYRTFEFNRAGKLDTISAESARVEITAAEACTGPA